MCALTNNEICPHLRTLLLPNAVCLDLTYNYFEKRHFQSTLNPLYEEIEIYPLLGKSAESNWAVTQSHPPG